MDQVQSQMVVNKKLCKFVKKIYIYIGLKMAFHNSSVIFWPKENYAIPKDGP
jgi:hypothetical protein